jgi:hypothetical protein
MERNSAMMGQPTSTYQEEEQTFVRNIEDLMGKKTEIDATNQMMTFRRRIVVMHCTETAAIQAMMTQMMMIMEEVAETVEGAMAATQIKPSHPFLLSTGPEQKRGFLNFCCYIHNFGKTISS